jgi:hypothetical protein
MLIFVEPERYKGKGLASISGVFSAQFLCGVLIAYQKTFDWIAIDLYNSAEGTKETFAWVNIMICHQTKPIKEGL